MTDGSAGRCPSCGAPLRPAGFFLDAPHEPHDHGVAQYAVDDAPTQPAEPADPPGVSSGRRRRVVAVALAALVATIWVGIAIARGGDDGEDGDREERAAATSTTERRRTTTTSTPATTTTLVFGPLLPEDTGLRLVVLRGHASSLDVDLDTGLVQDLPPVGLDVFQALVVGDSIVVSGPSGLHVFPLDLSSSGRPIGTADALFPSRAPGRVWTLRWQDRPGPHLEEIGVDGSVSLSPIELPANAGLRTILDGNALVDLSGHAFLLNLETGESRSLGPGVAVAVHETTVVRLSCGDDLECDLVVAGLDEPGGRRVDLPASVAVEPWQARLSPDGSVLTFPVYATDDGQVDRSLAIIDVTAAQLVATVPFDDGEAGAWSPSGDWLFLSTRSGLMAVHRSGSMYELDLPVGPRVQAVVVLPARV